VVRILNENTYRGIKSYQLNMINKHIIIKIEFSNEPHPFLFKQSRAERDERSNEPLLGTWFLLHITFPE
jgi:hypothetical protein